MFLTENLRKIYLALSLIFISFIWLSCTKVDNGVRLNDGYASSATSSKPNIIVILIDDIGYEIPQYTGGQSYSTPVMNSLATSGMQFTHCYASAVCSPSRISLMTGKYGFRNYHNWGVLDTSQKTVANILQDHGYKTCAIGKWQFDGGDISIHKFGFGTYSIFDPFTENGASDDGENETRYKNPLIYQDSAYLPSSETQGKYSDDMFADYASNFIIQNKSHPFFMYFAFSNCHKPFSPPPNNPDFTSWDPFTSQQNKKYFPYMVSYMDSKITNIINTVNSQGLQNNTYIFVFADNGTPSEIVSKYNNRYIQGGKGTTNEFGNHVPLVVIGPSIQPNSVCRDIIDFTDFMPTISKLAKVPKIDWANYGIMDGRSFVSQLHGLASNPRTWSYDYFFPNEKNVRNQFVYVQDTTYKLYNATYNNNFYNMQVDSLEQHPIPDNQLTPDEKKTKRLFQNVLANMHN